MSYPYTISPISDGQYHVRVHLDEWLSAEQIAALWRNYDRICQEDDDFRKVARIDGNILQYKSESLFPSLEKLTIKRRWS